MEIMKLFVGLILEYKDCLYKIAKARLKNEDDVCDVVQDTLISAYKSIRNLKQTKYFKTWLIRILINNCNEYYSKFSHNNISMDEVESYGAKEDFTNNYNMDDLTQCLNPDEKTILILYYLEGYKEKEISKLLNINYATIRTKIRRAKTKLTLNLSKEDI